MKPLAYYKTQFKAQDWRLQLMLGCMAVAVVGMVLAGLYELLV